MSDVEITVGVLRTPGNVAPCKPEGILRALLARRATHASLRSAFFARGNCHPVTMALAADLVGAHQRGMRVDPFTWRVNLGMCVNGPHSYLSHGGWVIEASNGKVENPVIVVLDRAMFASTLAPKSERSWPLRDLGGWGAAVDAL